MIDYHFLGLLLAFFLAVVLLFHYCARHHFWATFRFCLYGNLFGGDAVKDIVATCRDGCPTNGSRIICAINIVRFVAGVALSVHLTWPRVQSVLLPVIRELRGVFVAIRRNNASQPHEPRESQNLQESSSHSSSSKVADGAV